MIWDVMQWVLVTGYIIAIGYFAAGGWYRFVDSKNFSFGYQAAFQLAGLSMIVLFLLVPWIVLVGEDVFPSMGGTPVECNMTTIQI